MMTLPVISVTSVTMVIRRLAAVAALCVAQFAVAQQPVPPIERVKMTDNDLTCAQLHAEVSAMDKIVAQYQSAEAEAQSGGGNDGVTGATIDIFGHILGVFGGTLGQIFGGVAAQAATRGAAEAKKEAMLRTQEHSRQAAARKEHLTTVFVTRGCRVSDLTYTPSAPAPAPSIAAPDTARGSTVPETPQASSFPSATLP